MSNPLVITVTDNIYCVIRRSYFTCSYIVVTGDGIVLVDAGMKSTGVDMLFALDKIGAKVQDLKAILLTHWHNDHAAGASLLSELSGATIYCHANDGKHLTRESATVGLKARISDLVPEMGPLVLIKGILGEAVAVAVKAPTYLKDGEIIANDFEVVETLGHTEGHLSYYYRPQKILFTGDALAVVDGRLRFMARPVTPDLKAARASMVKCLERDIEIICPGHREPMLVNVPAEVRRLQAVARSESKWPLFG